MGLLHPYNHLTLSPLSPGNHKKRDGVAVVALGPNDKIEMK
jgi:hypothetical protein